MSYEMPYSPAECVLRDEVEECLGDLAPTAYVLQTEMSITRFPFLALVNVLREYRSRKPDATQEEAFEAVKDTILASADLSYLELD